MDINSKLWIMNLALLLSEISPKNERVGLF